jgi:hypothetical protein
MAATCAATGQRTIRGKRLTSVLFTPALLPHSLELIVTRLRQDGDIEDGISLNSSPGTGLPRSRSGVRAQSAMPFSQSLQFPRVLNPERLKDTISVEWRMVFSLMWAASPMEHALHSIGNRHFHLLTLSFLTICTSFSARLLNHIGQLRLYVIRRSVRTSYPANIWGSGGNICLGIPGWFC